MSLHNIETGKLFTDLETPYDNIENKIDVYTESYWTANNKEEYLLKEEMINEYSNENNLFKMVAWCDVSGYDYWVVQQEEHNYVSIDVHLKKSVTEYTQEEMIIIREAIILANEYFCENLNQ